MRKGRERVKGGEGDRGGEKGLGEGEEERGREREKEKGIRVTE